PAGALLLPHRRRARSAGGRGRLGWLSVPRPPRLPLLLERWFPPSIATGSRQCVSAIGRVAAPPCSEMEFPLAVDLSTRNDEPPRTLATGGIAARVSGSGARAGFGPSPLTAAEAPPRAPLST